MPTVISQPPPLRLAIAPGVTSSRLSDLLALQRAEEPEVTIALLEVRGDEILGGLKDGHYDAAMSLQGATDSALHTQPLWIEHMAVAMPLRSSLMDHAKLAIAELLDHPVFRWQA
ncbi:LysR family transcriptional regulator, partial [Salmonella enterica subsp. enterica]|nr:LysR family transcriptional regulator [Salmonella enterica subsp. enterica serovar Cerro]